MARRRSSKGMKKPRKIGTEELNRNKYSSMATSGHLNDLRFGFTSRKNGKIDVCVFYAKFAAKMFLDLMISDDEIEWLDDRTIRTYSDVIITCENLKKIYDHSLTYNQVRYYTLDESYVLRALTIQSDSHAKNFAEMAPSISGRRNSRKGMTLMKAIAAEVKMSPREARGILRDKMDKPKQGWAWRTTDEVNEIKKILNDGRK